MDYEPVKISEIQEIVSPIIESILGEEGFECTADLKWVRCEKEPIRQIFELVQWKGGMVAARFGISLDFVPHVSGSSVKWHRTNKSAQSDLIYDIYDHSLEFPYRKGKEIIQELAPVIIPSAIERAHEFWSMCSKSEELSQAFEAVRLYYDKDLPEGRSKFSRFVPHELALSFVLAREGKKKEALDLFNKISDEPSYKKQTKQKLEALLIEDCNA